MAAAKRQTFPADLHIRVPVALTEAVDRAANQNMTTSSEYIRQAIIARLKSEDSTQMRS